MKELPRFWRKTHWLDFPFLKFEVLGELKYFNQQSFINSSIYATAAKTGVTLMQKEYHQYLGGELSKIVLFWLVLHMRSQTQKSQIYCHLDMNLSCKSFVFTFIMAISFLVDILCGST